MSSEEEFPLVDIVENLSDQLRDAQERAAESEKESILALAECRVELALTWERRKEGGIDFRVVKLGAEGTRSRVQTISLTMVPARSDSSTPFVAEVGPGRPFIQLPVYQPPEGELGGHQPLG